MQAPWLLYIAMAYMQETNADFNDLYNVRNCCAVVSWLCINTDNYKYSNDVK